MNRPTERSWDDTLSETQSYSYTSAALKLFVDSIEQHAEGQLLDIGPIYDGNIQFFCQRVKRLYVCDLYRFLDKDLRTGFPPGRYWRHLDYPRDCFEGILLWDLIDRLNDPEAYSLVKRCHTLTKPGGLVLLFTFGKQVSPTGRETGVIRGDFQLHLRELTFANLPIRYRQNRDILELLAPFVPLKSLIYRNGIREFVFQRD